MPQMNKIMLIHTLPDSARSYSDLQFCPLRRRIETDLTPDRPAIRFFLKQQ